MTHFERFIGHTFDDRYTVVSVIGEGESAVVFGAFDKETGETVALKMLHPDCDKSSEAAERFETEISLLSLFDHPHIVKLLDTSKGGEYRYFVMEYIEGITLKKHIIERGALDMEEILFLSRQILSALEHVHDKGIVHSDIKPQNMVIVASGDIKLMDFGISKALAAQSREIADVAVGTVQYVSPEQAEGKPLDHLSDIYSFGVMLYEMATGILPFIHENANRIAAMHVHDEPIPPSYINESIPEGLERVILRAMEKDPIDRFLSASELLCSLEGFREETPPPPPERLSVESVFRRHNLPSLFAGILAALLVSMAIGFGALASRFSEQEKTAAYGKIPDLVGLTAAEIASLDLDENFYELRIEYVEKDKKAGLVLSQRPSADSVVEQKNGERVTVTLKMAKLPLPKELPDLSHLSLSRAEEYLSAFVCQTETVFLPHALLPEGEVILALRTGEESVLLYVSEGYRESMTEIPSFIGLSLEEAQKTALECGLTGVLFEGGGSRVTLQSLPAGTSVDAATAPLVLTLGK